MDKMTVPKCRCGRPCKKSDRWIQVTGSMYYATCGRPECAKHKKRIMHPTVGVKPKKTGCLSIYGQRAASKICHICGGPKETGKHVCENCREKAIKKSRFNFVWSSSKILSTNRLKKIQKMERDIKRKQETRLFFKKMWAKAKRKKTGD